jgi:glycosyltransferase involved in cell wall biosynthesis
MRICFYTETALPKIGGQQVVVDRLARELVALGHDVTVLTQPPRRPLVADDSAYPYRVVRHPRFVSTTAFVGWYRRYLLRLHREQPFDIVHCHSLYPTAWVASLAKRRLGVPLVLTSHGGDVREGGLRLRKPKLHGRYVRAVRDADALVAISRFTRDGYLRFDPDAGPRVVDIPNGVDLAEYAADAVRPADLDPAVVPGRYVLFLGRLSRQKGVDVLIDAVSQLPAEHAGVPLVVAGDGPERERLTQQSARLGTGRVKFVGPRTGSDKVWLLRNAACVVMPSRDYEAFGLVALESHAAGRPVVVTDLPGLADLVCAERTGLVVPPESPQSLAAAIRRMLGHPAEADAMGEEGRRSAQGYDWRNVAARHVELYERLTRPAS